MKHLIFDFDGVLGNTHDPRLEVLQEMEKEKSLEEIIAAGNRYFTKSTHMRSSNVSETDLQGMREWTTQFGTLLHEKGFDLFLDFIEELKAIPDAKLAVVSSGSHIYIKPRLGKCGLHFTHILSFEDHHSKEEKVEGICRDWNVPLDEVYFFTDTVSDVMELQNILDKNKIYGCAWGYQGREKLLTALDGDHILDHFSDIRKLF